MNRNFVLSKDFFIPSLFFLPFLTKINLPLEDLIISFQVIRADTPDYIDTNIYIYQTPSCTDTFENV